MPRTPRIHVLLLGLGVVFACAAPPPPPPSWIDERPAAYADDRWVVAIGHGSSASEAEAAALADVERQTKGETDGAVVSETWHNPQSKESWAMAVLDVVPIRTSLESERTEIAAEIVSRLAAAEGALPERALPELAAAMGLTAARETLDERIGNLGGTSASDPVVPERTEIEERLAAVKRVLTIEIESYEMHPKTGEIGDPIDETRRALAKKVIELGFAVGDALPAWGDDESWLVVTSRVALERLELHQRDTLVAVHWDAALEIKSRAESGKVVAILTEEGRATHLNEPEARRQAHDDARDFAAGALDDWLGGQVGAQAP